MPSTARHHQRSFFTMPRDYVERRRARRRLTNFMLIPVLSIVAAYAITRPTGGTGFPFVPKGPQSQPASQQAAVASVPAPAPAPVAPADSATPAVSRANRGAYDSGMGPYAVSEIKDLTLHDASRNKDLHVRIFYPTDAGPFPVIVFSHGAGGSQSCCEALTRHWATYGFVTIQPTHEDSVLLRQNSGDENANFLKAINEALKKPAYWESRPKDISFVLDSLSTLQTQAPALSGKLDAKHIGVGGHSMGAFTAGAIAGALVNLPGHPASSFADSRVQAVLMLSPQGPGEFGLTDHSWDHVKLPFLSMTGSLDSGAASQGPEWKKIPFERSEPGDKYHLFIDGAGHMSFISANTLVPARAVQAQAILGYTNFASLAFWDAYLKGDANAKKYLLSDDLPDFSNGAARLSRR
jgi:predicted dienelactone hydrolase